MAVSYTKAYKDNKKLEYKIAVRQGMFITDYVKTKYEEIYQEAAELYNSINRQYPRKPNLLKTTQYRQWKNGLFSQNQRPVRRIPRQRDRYFKPTEYPYIPPAEDDNNGTCETSTSQLMGTTQFVLEIPLLNHNDTNITRAKRNGSDQHNQADDQTEPPPQQDGGLNESLDTSETQTQCTEEGDQHNQADDQTEAPPQQDGGLNESLDTSVFDGVPDSVIDQIITDLRRDPDLSQIMDDIQNVIDEGTTGLEIDLQDPLGLEIDLPDLQDPLQEEMDSLFW